MNPNEPEQNVTPPTAQTLTEVCNILRNALSDPEKALRSLVTEKAVSGEAASQAMLAVRHLEDARMRIGKVIQHGVNGGVSIYDGKTVP